MQIPAKYEPICAHYLGKIQICSLKKTKKTPWFLKVYKIKISYFFTLYMVYFMVNFDFITYFLKFRWDYYVILQARATE